MRPANERWRYTRWLGAYTESSLDSTHDGMLYYKNWDEMNAFFNTLGAKLSTLDESYMHHYSERHDFSNSRQIDCRQGKHKNFAPLCMSLRVESTDGGWVLLPKDQWMRKTFPCHDVITLRYEIWREAWKLEIGWDCVSRFALGGRGIVFSYFTSGSYLWSIALIGVYCNIVL